MDKELRRLMDKNRAETTSQMERLQASFSASVAAINKQMKKDRRNNEKALGRATAGLYATLTKNAKAQGKKNKALTMATRRAAMDAAAALSSAKNQFAQQLGAMHKTVQRLQQKQNARLNKLTGIVEK